MGNKSVSLFEVLPPRSTQKVDDIQVRSGSGNSTPKEKKDDPSQSDPKPDEVSSGARLSVDDTASSGASAASSRRSVDEPKAKEEAQETTAASTSKDSLLDETTSVERHSLTGVSARKKEDHFFLILGCMVVFSILVGLASYRYGYRKGIGEGYQAGIARQSASNPALEVTRSMEPLTLPPSNSDRGSNEGGFEVLPTRLQAPTPEQKKAVAPPTTPKRYTLQVQTMGRNQRQATDELLQALRAQGFDAFADYSDGAVFVGRLESSRDSDSKELKNEIAKFNWRNANFSSAYFRRIPKHLMEN